MEQILRDAWEQELNLMARSTVSGMPSRHMLNVVRATALLMCDETSIAMDEELERLSRVMSLLPNHVCPTLDARACVATLRTM